MAAYKKNCARCGTMIDGDARHCPSCGSGSPFGHNCPSCLWAIKTTDVICPGCGRQLLVACPACGGSTFAGEVCEKCGASLMIKCNNPRCGERQFFQNTKCTACGKKIEAR